MYSLEKNFIYFFIFFLFLEFFSEYESKNCAETRELDLFMLSSFQN